MLDANTIAEIAKSLATAERTRERIPPLAGRYPGLDVADAYAIQSAWMDLKFAEGRTVKGHKIGLTSKAMQRMVDFNEPDYGVLLDDMFYEDGAEIPFDRFITPMVECELAFVLGKPLSGPDCTMADVLEATSYVVPAVEIVDVRTLDVDPATSGRRTIMDNIADNAANAALVLGGRPVRPDAVDLRWVAALCRRNGVIEESGVAAAVLNHPARGIEWLARKLSQFDVGLKAGEVVLAGSFTRIVLARKNDQFHVDYGKLGSISFSFV